MLNFLAAVSGNGAGGGGSFESIATATPSAGATSVSFSSIPTTYQHLQLRIHIRKNTGAGAIGVYQQFNSDTASNYAYHELNGNGASVSASGFANQTEIYYGFLGSDTNAGVVIVDIHDYANTSKFKTLRVFAGRDFNGSGDVRLVSGLWRSTAAITSMQFLLGGTQIGSGTTFALYGIKGA